MTHEDDFIDQLEGYLDEFEGTTPLPDAVRDAVRAQVPTIKQIGPLHGLMRDIVMTSSISSPARYGLAAAVIVGAVTIGGALFLDRSGPPPGSTPSPSAAPSSTPEATPREVSTPGVAEPLPSDGPLAAGRYAIAVPFSTVTAEITISTPGWSSGGYYVSDGPRAISFWTVGSVYTDACDGRTEADPPIGPTVDDLVSALDAQINTDLQPFSNPIVGGHPSSRVVMTPAENITCALARLWTQPDNTPGRGIDAPASPDGLQDVIWMVDVDGQRVVIVGYYNPTGDDVDLILPMIDSITFSSP